MARDRILAACRKNGVAFLQGCTPDNIVARIDEGVRVVAGHSEAGAKGQGPSATENAGVNPPETKTNGGNPCRLPISSSAPPSAIPPNAQGVRRLVFARTSAGCGKTFGVQTGWRFWSATDPSLLPAMYQFADQAALERATGGEEIKRLVADFEPRLARRDADARGAGAGGGVSGDVAVVPAKRPVFACCASFAGLKSAEAPQREGGSNPLVPRADSWMRRGGRTSGAHSRDPLARNDDGRCFDIRIGTTRSLAN